MSGNVCGDEIEVVGYAGPNVRVDLLRCQKDIGGGESRIRTLIAALLYKPTNTLSGRHHEFNGEVSFNYATHFREATMPSQSNARRSRIETAAGSGVGAARVLVKIDATARDWRTKLKSMI